MQMQIDRKIEYSIELILKTSEIRINRTSYEHSIKTIATTSYDFNSNQKFQRQRLKSL